MLSHRCSPAEIRAHLESIARVPAEILPHDELPRLALVGLAAAGYDVCCFTRRVGRHVKTIKWFVWLGPLADRRPDHKGRVTLAEWCRRWRSLVRDMGVEPAAEGGDDAHA